ncbi:MAG: hypothetical protein JXA03_09570 [Bacteroidales bacterium]|nr:hypothetical protein [Bacteroidales bacterium]
MLKLVPLVLYLLVFSSSSFAQVKVVDAKGLGINREDAIQDALRNAVGQAAGVSVASQTVVENFMVLKDAIATNSKGYVAEYDIVDETKITDGYEVTVRASVSLSPLEADAGLLARQIGGLRFLVMYDKRNSPGQKTEELDFAVDAVNNYLASKQYRYIEKSRFDRLREEAFLMMKETDTAEMTFVQKLGIMSGAQFIILIDKIQAEERSENFDTRKSSRVRMQIKAFDNCTAEGLGTAVLESEWVPGSASDLTTGITRAVHKDIGKLMSLFNSYIGSWINNGTPYELRFYQVGTFRDFRDLRNSIKESPDFGGQIEITGLNNFTRLNATFRSVPDDVAFNILDYADAIPGFKEKTLDVLLIYGRQISFAPRNVVVPEIEENKKLIDKN